MMGPIHRGPLGGIVSALDGPWDRPGMASACSGDVVEEAPHAKTSGNTGSTRSAHGARLGSCYRPDPRRRGSRCSPHPHRPRGATATPRGSPDVAAQQEPCLDQWLLGPSGRSLGLGPRTLGRARPPRFKLGQAAGPARGRSLSLRARTLVSSEDGGRRGLQPLAPGAWPGVRWARPPWAGSRTG